MKIALFHYQLNSGGKTDAIINSVRFLLDRFNELTEIRLVTGLQGDAFEVLKEIRMGFDRYTADKLHLDILEELTGIENSNKDEIGRLIAKLKARYGEDTLWWVHDYHCGLSPVFTAGFVLLILLAWRFWGVSQ